MKKLIGVTLLLAAGACGDKRSDDGVSTLGGALLTVSSKLAAVGSLGYDTTAFNVQIKNAAQLNYSHTQFSPLTGTAFASNWDGVQISKGDSSGNTVSMKDFMGLQLDPAATGSDNGREFAINVFGRFKSATMVACAMGTLGAVDANGYPVNGSAEITLTPANLAVLVSSCGMTQADADYMGALDSAPVVGTTVTDTTDSTVYDKKIVMELDPVAMGGGTQTLLVRFNSSEINILDVETGGQNTSRTLVAYDVATKVLKVEYFSGSTTSFWYYRLYYDETNDQGRLVGNIGGDTNFTRYSLAGKPNASGTFALSMRVEGSTDYTHNACVNSSTGNITDDGVLTCTVTGTDLAVSGFDWLETARTARADAGWATISETRTANWTIDTTFTAAAQY